MSFEKESELVTELSVTNDNSSLNSEFFKNAETQCYFCEFLFDESPFAITFWSCEKSCSIEPKSPTESVSFLKFFFNV